MLPQLPAKPYELGNYKNAVQQQTINHNNLEYPLIPQNVAVEYVSGISDEIQIPQYFHDLTTNKLQELLDNKELLRGYILSRHGKRYEDLKEDIIKNLQKQIDYLEGLKIKYTDKDNGIIQQIKKLSSELKAYKDKMDTFDKMQVEMFDKFNKLSKDKIAQLFENDMLQQEKKCDDLLNETLNTDGQLDDDQLQIFIETYEVEREEFYLKREKLARIKEDRVVGLE